MNIETGQFTPAEYVKVKVRFIDGKAPWPDISDSNDNYSSRNPEILQLQQNHSWILKQNTHTTSNFEAIAKL